MATSFPGALDAFTNPIASDTLDNPPHDEQHADINDAMEAVQAKLGVGAHTIGEWTTFTPVWTNLTVGNGTVIANYSQINDIVFVNGRVIFGSTTSITGPVSMGHPVSTAGPTGLYQSNVRMFDSGTANFAGIIQINSTTISLLSMSIVSNTVRPLSLSSTSPFTWTTNDELNFNYNYKLA